ncbi:MAG: BACON domain-containing protein, partial [Nitrospira sp.]|nr:BACON domain-containing protein [Nitrospira sp.]
TLTWTANSETDLAGYRVYSCTVANCSLSSGNAMLLATLGQVTSFNFGTPATTQYYFLTAFDFANAESLPSSLVTYTPSSNVPPAIGVSSTSFTFAATQGGAIPAYQSLDITNTGGGTLSWTASENAGWLSLSQTSGSGNTSVRVNVTTGGLVAGTYSGSIIISASGASSVTVPVMFTVTSTAVPVIQASPMSFVFAATQGGANPGYQTLTITNTGGGTLNWTASESAGWLSLSQTSGSGDASVRVSVTTGTLAVGTYSRAITIGATGASSVTVSVTFTITAGSSLPPAVGVSPTSLSFTARRGGANPAPRSFNIFNAGGGVLTWYLDDTASWIFFSPREGNQNGAVTVSVATGALAVGVHRREIRIWQYGVNTAAIVPITVTITK